MKIEYWVYVSKKDDLVCCIAFNNKNESRACYISENKIKITNWGTNNFGSGSRTDFFLSSIFSDVRKIFFRKSSTFGIIEGDTT